MNKPIIIGIYATMQSGKSVVSEAFPLGLQSALRKKVRVQYISISSLMKDAIFSITGIERDEHVPWILNYVRHDEPWDYSHSAKNTYLDGFGCTLGVALQKFGLVIKETFGDNIWVDRALAQVDPTMDFVIVDGVRFKSDIDRIKKKGGVVIKITRDIDTASDSRDADHPTEVDLLTYEGFSWEYENKETSSREAAVDAARFAIRRNFKKICDGRLG